jgi:hypothetical protein
MIRMHMYTYTKYLVSATLRVFKNFHWRRRQNMRATLCFALVDTRKSEREESESEISQSTRGRPARMECSGNGRRNECDDGRAVAQSPSQHRSARPKLSCEPGQCRSVRTQI